MRFLVLQHLAAEHPGILRDFMRAEGIGWDTVELDQDEPLPALEPYAAMIVMGGPMDVWEEARYPWLAPEKAAIATWVGHLRRPFLGICLGHQLLAAALGGRVDKAASAEVGVLPVTLSAAGAGDTFCAGLTREFPCLQWHGAEISAPPPGARVLAYSPACAVQAMAYGQHALSLQFHVEIVSSTVDEWAAIPAYLSALNQTFGPAGQKQLRAAAASRLPQFNALARRLYDNWRAAAFRHSG